MQAFLFADAAYNHLHADLKTLFFWGHQLEKDEILCIYDSARLRCE